jgi:hypothetical protein
VTNNQDLSEQLGHLAKLIADRTPKTEED